MRYALILSALLPLAANATDYISETFAEGIPAGFGIAKDPAATLTPGVYNTRLISADDAWTAGQLPDGKGRAAIAPTHRADRLPSDSRMIQPAVSLTDRAVVYWEARSLHKEIAETYRVDIREAGTDAWTTLYASPGESHGWSSHVLKLDAYAGKTVEVSFVATTTAGFILAVDNVKVGVPADRIVSYASATPHFTVSDATAAIRGTLTSYGTETPWQTVELRCSDGYTASADVPALGCGESCDVRFDIAPATDERVDYTLVSVGPDGEEVLYTDFVYCSGYPRLNILDRCTGTWCNNCPMMELTVTRLEQRYGDEILVIEPHVNDVLAEPTYWSDYLADFCFAIPQLVPNHNVELGIHSLSASDYAADRLCRLAPVQISSTAEYSADGTTVTIESMVECDRCIDNSDGRYRIGHMVIADFHDPAEASYIQRSQPSSYLCGQFYFMPSTILPEMMYYTNVPVETSTATNGVAGSLPSLMQPADRVSHKCSVAMPEGFTGTNVRVVSMVIDTATGDYINAAVTPVAANAGISDVMADDSTDTVTYDLCGRRVTNPAKGLYIRNGRKVIIR